MNSGDFSDVPNPFAMLGQKSARPRSRALWKAAKFLCLVLACFAIVLSASVASKRFLVYRLTNDFDALGPAERQTRLVQLAQLGSPAVVPLVDAMADEDIHVARTAFDLLHTMQNEWTLLNSATCQTKHRELVAALRSMAVQIPDDRTGWPASLLQQTISDFVTRTDSTSRSLYREANETLERLTLSSRSGPSIVADAPLDPQSPQRLQVKSRPLPVQPLDEDLHSPSASIYKSASMRLQPIAPESAVVLREVNQPSPMISEKPIAPVPPESRETPYQIQQTQSVGSTIDTSLVTTPMQTYDDVSVIHWLASDNEPLREQAKLELSSRGYGESELALATAHCGGGHSDTNAVGRHDRHRTLDRPTTMVVHDEPRHQPRCAIESRRGDRNDG